MFDLKSIITDGGIILFISAWLIGLYGYALNIIAVANTISDPVSTIFILRCIGIAFSPLGIAMGFGQ